MEFVIAFPVVIWFIMSIFEVGFIATRIVLLEHGLDVASRDLRIGSDPAMDHDKLKQNICARSRVVVNCERDLVLELVELDVNAAYPHNQPNCTDRTEEIEPTIEFNPGGRNRIMFVRACMIIDPIFPGLGLTLGLRKDRTGGYQAVVYSAFLNEPA